jgi:cadmium resistance protein CadD (predicted permease)
MSRKRKKIIVGTAALTFAGWFFAEAQRFIFAESMLVIGLPLIVGLSWAFLADGKDGD